MGLGSELIKTTCTLSGWVFLIYRSPESHYSVPPRAVLPAKSCCIYRNKKEDLVEDEAAANADTHTLTQNAQVSRSDSLSSKRALTPKSSQCRDVQNEFILQVFLFRRSLGYNINHSLQSHN